MGEMSEIQFFYGSWPDDQRLAEAERLRGMTIVPREVRYWDGFILGVRRVMAGEEVWGGQTTVDMTHPEIDCGIADGWRGVNPVEGLAPGEKSPWDLLMARKPVEP